METVAQPARVSTAHSIPYRNQSPVSTEKVASVLLVTLLLLATLLSVLLLARRRGWLARWSSAKAGRPAKRGALQVLANTRLSAATQAYLLESEGARFVVLESTRHLAVTRTTIHKEDADAPRAP